MLLKIIALCIKTVAPKYSEAMYSLSLNYKTWILIFNYNDLKFYI